MEERIAKKESSNAKTAQAGAETLKKQQEDVFTIFTQFMEDTVEKFSASNRVKMLIKNMLADRANGWVKAR